MKRFLLIVLFIKIGFAYSQNIKYIVKDSTTKEVLPFANILYANKKEGTISNRNGEFIVSNSRVSFWLSYLGYKTKKVIVNKNRHFVTIYLSKNAEELDEVCIASFSQKDLANIIRKSLKNRKRHRKKLNTASKTFIKLYSETDNQAIEYSEGFYRQECDYKGINKIFLKNGKYYFSRNNNTFYSINFITQLLSNIDIIGFDNAILGAISPLNMKSKNSMLRFYKLSTNSLIANVLNIQFQSKLNKKDKGNIYINIKENRLIKLQISKELKSNDVFISLNKNKKIKNVQINLTFKYNRNETLNFITGTSAFDYYGSNSTKHIKTYFASKAYDYKKPFQKLYNLNYSQFDDYELMRLIKINPIFWKDISVIKKTQKEQSFVQKMIFKENFQNLVIDSSFVVNQNLLLPYIPPQKISRVYRLHYNNSREDITITDVKGNPFFNLEIRFIANIFQLKDTLTYDVYPIIDYHNSYSLLPNKTKEAEVSKKLLDLANNYNFKLQKKIATELKSPEANSETIKTLLNTTQKYFNYAKEDLLSGLSEQDTTLQKRTYPKSSRERLKELFEK